MIMFNLFSFLRTNYNTNQPNKYIQGLSSILHPYDFNRSILQAKWIRDNIGIKKFVKKILIEEMKFDLDFQIWDLEEFYQTKSDLHTDDREINKKVKNFFAEKIKKIEEDKKYFIYVEIPGHVNFIYIDTTNHCWSYYFYEPHLPKKLEGRYSIIRFIDNILESFGYLKKNLPEYVLKQDELPLCYMYTIHFFICLFISGNDCEINKKISDDKVIDDIYIMDFTKHMLKLCHKYSMINTLDYYFLVNNTFKIYEMIENNNNFFIQNLLEKTCDPDVIAYVLKKYSHIELNINSVNNLYNEDIKLDYLNLLFDKLKDEDLQPELKHKIFLLSTIVKHMNKSDNINIENKTWFHINKRKIDDNLLKILFNKYDLLNLWCDNCKMTECFLNLFRSKYVKENIINQKDNNGETLLIQAVNNENKEMIKLLLKHKCDITIKNNENMDAVNILVQNKDFELLGFIQKLMNRKRKRED